LKNKPLSIFPNPASIHVEVGFTNAGAAFDAQLTLHSLGGSLISATQVRVQTDSNVFFLDVSSLSVGTYFIRLENKQNGRAEVSKLNVVR
jgi:hypothetical protein